MAKTNVTYDSAGIPLAAHLYTPDDSHAGPRPAIIVGHPGSGEKEQASGLYARLLAENGFVALAYDSAYQGESGGEPRGLEDPAHRMEDLKAGVSFLTTHGEVDPNRIGALGICASGGYVLCATASDHRIKAVGTVSAVDIARQFRNGADGTQDPAVFQHMLDAAAAARTAEARGEGPQSFQLFPDTAEQARARGGQYGLEGFEYYISGPTAHPRSAKFLTWSSIDHMAFFDAACKHAPDPNPRTGGDGTARACPPQETATAPIAPETADISPARADLTGIPGRRSAPPGRQSGTEPHPGPATRRRRTLL